ncbi:hypothetical protein, partial [Hungatella effluvii]
FITCLCLERSERNDKNDEQSKKKCGMESVESGTDPEKPVRGRICGYRHFFLTTATLYKCIRYRQWLIPLNIRDWQGKRFRWRRWFTPCFMYTI